MATSKAQIKATAKYKEKNYSRIPLDVPKEFHSYLKGVSESQGMSVNGFIKEAIEEKCSRRDGEDLPHDFIPKAINWLKNRGLTDTEITDFIMYIGS